MTKMMLNQETEAGKELVRQLVDGLPVIVEALDRMSDTIWHSNRERSDEVSKYATSLERLYNDMILEHHKD